MRARDRAESPATGGIHGVGMRRDVGFVLDIGTPAFVQALEDAVVALMIEKKPAVEDLDAILSVPASTWSSSAPPTTR